MNKIRKLRRILLMLVVVLMVIVPVKNVKAAGLPFTDVKESDWFYSYVKFVYEENLMSGMGGGTLFAPLNELERAQFAMVLYRQNGSPEVKYDGKYPDVAAGEWYTDAVAWASKEGIVSGYGDGRFGPNDKINREQIAIMMYRYAKYKGCDISKIADIGKFADAEKVSDYAKNALKWAVGNGVVTGKNGNLIDPQGKANRAECAAILTRFVNLLRNDDSSAITRGKWMQDIMEHLTGDIAEKPDKYYYSDTKDSEYGSAIELAKELGILPDSEDTDPKFNPENKATREFVAMTVSNAMGYHGTYEIECNEFSTLEYPNEVAAVVINGYMNLENNAFYPKRGLKQEEENLIFAKIDEINAEIQQTPEELADIDYADTVVAEELSKNKVYTVEDQNDGTYKVIISGVEDTNIITENSIFVLPASDKYYSGWALEAVSVKKENDTLTVIARKPEELADVVNSLDLSGKGSVVEDRITTSDDVEATFIPAEKSEAGTDVFATYGNLIDSEGATDGSGTLDLLVKEKELNDHLKISGSVKLHIPSIGYKLNAELDKKNGFQLNEFLLTVANKLDVEANFEYQFESEWNWDSVNKTAGNVELCRIPIALGNPSFTFDLVFYYHYDIQGKASVTYNLETVNGIQIKNGTARYVSDYSQKFDMTILQGEGKAGVKFAGQLTAFYLWPIVGVDCQLGMGFDANAEYRDETGLSPMLCIDGGMHVYGELGLDKDTLVGEFADQHWNIPLSWEFWNENNTILKGRIHFENGTKVPECTYGKEYLTLIFRGVFERHEFEEIKVVLKDQSGNQKECTGAALAAGVLVNPGKYKVIVDDARGLYKQLTKDIQIESGERYYEEIQLETVFAGGDGSEENPFQIADANQLDKIRYVLEGEFVQTSDIDLSVYKSWEPIGYWEGSGSDGNYDNAFKGGYDGQGYKIENMTINRNDRWGHLNHPSGLFGYCMLRENNCLQNINLSNINITHTGNKEYGYDENYIVGGVVGWIESAGTEWGIKNCNTQGKISVYDNVEPSVTTTSGGIAGCNFRTNIYGCVSDVDIASNVEVNGSTLGGIVGLGYSKILKCVNKGNIISNAGDEETNVMGICGGIVGGGCSAEIGYCINYGNIQCRGTGFPMEVASGGILGSYSTYNKNTITDSINYGDVSAYTYSKDIIETDFGFPVAGGIEGNALDDIVEKCYNIDAKIIATKTYKPYDYNYPIHHGRAGKIVGDSNGTSLSGNYSILTTERAPSIASQEKEWGASHGDDGDGISQEEIVQKIQYILDAVKNK